MNKHPPPPVPPLPPMYQQQQRIQHQKSPPPSPSLLNSSIQVPVSPSITSHFKRPSSIASMSSNLSYGAGPAGALRRNRKKNVSTNLNLMVVGFQGLGKTSFLRLLYQTLNKRDLELEKSTTSSTPRTSISSVAHLIENMLQQPLPKFFTNKRTLPKRTSKITSGTIPIIHQNEKINLTLIDTPGLSMDNELVLDTQVTEILKYIESRMDEALIEEGRVRRSKSREKYEYLIHTVLYFMNPMTIFEGEIPSKVSSTRMSRSNSLSSHTRKRAMSTSNKPSNIKSSNQQQQQDQAEESEEEEENDIDGDWSSQSKANATNPDAAVGLSAKDLRIIKRLSRRVNVIPVLPKADMLTTRQLAACREKIRQDLEQYDLNIFHLAPDILDGMEEEDEEEEEDFEVDEDEEIEKQVENSDQDEMKSKSKRHIHVSNHIPFVLIAPEPTKTTLSDRPLARNVNPMQQPLSPPASPRRGSTPEPIKPTQQINGNESTKQSNSSPKFCRSFPWGTIDCLNPAHTDFENLRKILLGQPNFNRLKQITGEFYYEVFRTERLTARNMSKTFGEMERRKLLDDLRKI